MQLETNGFSQKVKDALSLITSSRIKAEIQKEADKLVEEFTKRLRAIVLGKFIDQLEKAEVTLNERAERLGPFEVTLVYKEGG